MIEQNAMIAQIGMETPEITAQKEQIQKQNYEEKFKMYNKLSKKELEEVKEYWEGQESDGWGEGFEQQDIPVEDGVLNVHFWNSEVL
jgi:predicted house-cleaning noncanonical NTP pyrophosphatase (MazG superfamily)